MDAVPSASQAVERLNVEGLTWLADAPMFIDKEQVEAFYDAIVRPETKSGAVQTTRTVVNELKGKLTVGAEAGVKPPKLFQLFPFLNAELKVSGGAEGEAGHTDQTVRQAEYLPIDTPQRQLVRLALHYFTEWPDRTVLVTETGYPGEGWWDPSFVRETPRALVYIDFPAKTVFIPAAAEVANGKVVVLYTVVAKKYSKGPGDDPPEYPGSELPVSPEAAAKHAAYWDWFASRIREYPRHATEAVEDTIAAGGGRVQWINYRVPLKDGKTMHLNVCGRGAFDTGTFAYNLVQRGFRHGVRLVGTLKSEPDINVLALFEK
jgi:hypothetical protein